MSKSGERTSAEKAVEGAAHGSAAICEWEKSKGVMCDSHAVWTAPTQRGRWMLCDFHKTMLLTSYNETYRRVDEPKWRRLPMPPNE